MSGSERDTIGLTLEGETVSLASFVQATESLQKLVDALATEGGTQDAPQWEIDALSRGSATIRIRPSVPDDPVARRVVANVTRLGRQLAEGLPSDYSYPVNQAVSHLTDVLNDGVKGILLMTNGRPFRIQKPTTAAEERRPQMTAAYGTVEGTVSTLLGRHGIGFTLYDTLFDTAVRCHIDESMAEQVSQLWLKRAVVHGTVVRDADTGEPQEVRDVTGIAPLPEKQRGLWREVRGIYELKRPPEDIIRSVRDEC